MNSRNRHAGSTLTLLVAAAGTAAVQAQQFDLSWNTIDGGGHMFSNGGGFELGGTIGQADAGVVMTGGGLELSGGFWPGASEAGGGCIGGERISNTSCKNRNGSNVLKVILVAGAEGDTFTVRLTDGSSKSGVINRRGKGKAKFNNRPAGDAGTATAEWGCGAADEKAYSCP